MNTKSKMSLKQVLQLLVTEARYAVNRLDSQGYSQIAGDLAIALAIVESNTGIKADFSIKKK